jgi:hypothetical protein
LWISNHLRDLPLVRLLSAAVDPMVMTCTTFNASNINEDQDKRLTHTMGGGPNVARYGVSQTLAGPNPLLWPGKKTTLTTGLHRARASLPDRLQSPPARRSPARRPASMAPPTRPPPAAVSALLTVLAARHPASSAPPSVRPPLGLWPPASRPHCHNHGWS